MSSDSSLTEWQTARDILDKFDERLHDLRKVGFSFITSLLTVDALLSPNSESWKLAALVATLFLIVPLDLVDRNYRVFLIAAQIRAQILERRNRMDLTQRITRMFETAHVEFFFEAVYVIFTLAVLLLGWIIFGAKASLEYWAPFVAFSVLTMLAVWFSLWQRSRKPQLKWLASIAIVLLPLIVLWLLMHPTLSLLMATLVQGQSFHYHLTLLVAVTIAVAAILYVETTVDINEWVDFGIDGYEYEKGEEVLVTISNIGYEELELGENAWTVHREDSPKTQLPVIVREPPVLPKYSTTCGSSWSDHGWLFPTEDLDPGLFRVVYNGPVYFRMGRYPRRGFKLLDPNVKEDKEELDRNGYDSWNHAAQRFRVLPKKDGSEITVNLREKKG